MFLMKRKKWVLNRKQISFGYFLYGFDKKMGGVWITLLIQHAKTGENSYKLRSNPEKPNSTKSPKKAWNPKKSLKYSKSPKTQSNLKKLEKSRKNYIQFPCKTCKTKRHYRRFNGHHCVSVSTEKPEKNVGGFIPASSPFLDSKYITWDLIWWAGEPYVTRIYRLTKFVLPGNWLF